MKGGTLFSGIGTPEIACPEIDWRWCAEVDPFAATVLKTRFQGVPNLGDVAKIDHRTIEPVDLVVFGSPCQSFSVAGKRLGVDDPRGNLAFIALALIGRLRPRWVVFENVPGLLSSDAGRDFGAFLGGLGECGYGLAYRVLDAQYFGVPQRRRRIFVVGCFDDWQRSTAVLFEPASLHGDPAPSREAGKRITPLLEVGARTNSDGERDGDGIGVGGDPMFTLQAGKQHGVASPLVPDIAGTLGAHKTVGWGQDTLEADGGLLAFGGGRRSGAIDVATTCTASVRIDFEIETFVVADPVSANEARTYTHEGRNNFRLRNVVQIQNATRGKSQNGLGVSQDDTAYTLDGASQHAIAFKASHFTRGKDGAPSKVAPTLTADADKGDQDVLIADTVSAKWHKGTGGPSGDEVQNLVAFSQNTRNEVRTSEIAAQLTTGDPGMSVRRLTPKECERLQGLPDDFTLVEYRGKLAADGPRYRSIGNAMAVPVVRWILLRLLEVDKLLPDDQKPPRHNDVGGRDG